MTDNPEVNENTVERDVSEEGLPPAGPRGADGESRIVAERSGADTTFPERPLLADPDDVRRTPGEEGSAGASQAERGVEDAKDEVEGRDGSGSPEPEVGPVS
ncbi:hypothetical protein ACFQVD_05485 [Streptosporangium amethystogenes subsp. fukuiense]|uniref:Uncharacterized protein n=1 Tax=Streptosporangium amethystogenes subsp. fukuiense TaxID=698418 RepID=A0ABW2STC8_9ACTN